MDSLVAIGWRINLKRDNSRVREANAAGEVQNCMAGWLSTTGPIQKTPADSSVRLIGIPKPYEYLN